MQTKIWFGQATTGAGFATLLGALGGLASGAVTWQQAVPLLIAGVAGMLWPEKPNAGPSLGKLTSDVEMLMQAFQQQPASVNTHPEASRSAPKPG